jgi:predicted signal transduction protein with EAL and GGDEF domain
MQIDQYPCLHVVKSGTESSIPKTCKADGNGNAYAAERHILPPNEDCRFVLAIVLRLNDFHLFRSLYGESFSRSLQETFASIVTRQGKILGVVSVQQLVESMAALQVEMAKGSNPLTGLSGNLALEKELEKRIDLGSSFYIVYADLDHFKAYNDAYGF